MQSFAAIFTFALAAVASARVLPRARSTPFNLVPEGAPEGTSYYVFYPPAATRTSLGFFPESEDSTTAPFAGLIINDAKEGQVYDQGNSAKVLYLEPTGGLPEYEVRVDRYSDVASGTAGGVEFAEFTIDNGYLGYNHAWEGKFSACDIADSGVQVLFYGSLPGPSASAACNTAFNIKAQYVGSA